MTTIEDRRKKWEEDGKGKEKEIMTDDPDLGIVLQIVRHMAIRRDVGMRSVLFQFVSF